MLSRWIGCKIYIVSVWRAIKVVLEPVVTISRLKILLQTFLIGFEVIAVLFKLLLAFELILNFVGILLVERTVKIIETVCFCLVEHALQIQKTLISCIQWRRP